MDSRDADLLKEIDPTQLGHRIRAARVAKGWTQAELAGGDISVGYVSRIESGQRRPNSAVLTDLAARLEVPVDHLLRGVTAREYDELKLTLDFAELSLESGEHLEAEAQARAVVDRATLASQPELAYRGRFVIARALEGQGSLDDAILELEPLVEAKTGGVLRIRAAIALCRCLREAGDLSAAIEVGERVVHDLESSRLDSCDEAVQLAVTLASAYFLRGDSSHAVRMCRKAIAKAETLASPTARAAAYWNASIFESRARLRGRCGAAGRAGAGAAGRGSGHPQPRSAAQPARHRCSSSSTAPDVVGGAAAPGAGPRRDGVVECQRCRPRPQRPGPAPAPTTSTAT